MVDLKAEIQLVRKLIKYQVCSNRIAKMQYCVFTGYSFQETPTLDNCGVIIFGVLRQEGFQTPARHSSVYLSSQVKTCGRVERHNNLAIVALMGVQFLISMNIKLQVTRVIYALPSGHLICFPASSRTSVEVFQDGYSSSCIHKFMAVGLRFQLSPDVAHWESQGAPCEWETAFVLAWLESLPAFPLAILNSAEAQISTAEKRLIRHTLRSHH